MPDRPYLPDDPLARFLDLAVEVKGDKRWFHDWSVLRGAAMACLVLMDDSPDSRPTLEQVRRMASVHAAMKSSHHSLTGRSDYPASALLASTGESVPDITRRLKRLYEGLHEFSFKRGNQLQLATHLLFFAPWPDDVLMGRFRAVYAAFKSRGLQMSAGDYDEVAGLAFLDHDPDRIVQRVLEDREVLREQMSPRPSKQEGFTLASSTAFLLLATRDAELQRMAGAMQMAQVITLLQVQQAAAVAMASAAAASAAAAS